MSGLAGVLLGLAALFAERAVRAARRGAVRSRVRGRGGGTGDVGPGDASRALLSRMPAWALWASPASVAGWVTGGPVGAALGAAAAVTGVHIAARRRRARVASARDEQLADAVRSVSSALRAGLSVPQALGHAAGESEEPLAGSLRALVDDVSMGLPLEEALERWVTALQTDDVRLVAGVLRLHRRSGGDLPAVLDQVVTTLRERRAAAREVRSFTAQARLSGAILGLLPIGFFGFLWLTSRREIQGAFESPAGILAIGLGLGLEGAAFVWIRRLLEVR